MLKTLKKLREYLLDNSIKTSPHEDLVKEATTTLNWFFDKYPIEQIPTIIFLMSEEMIKHCDTITKEREMEIIRLEGIKEFITSRLK